MKDNATQFELYLATITAAATVVMMVFFAGPFVVLLMAVTWLATWCIAWWTLTRIPGLTGDVYGAICEMMELLVCDDGAAVVLITDACGLASDNAKYSPSRMGSELWGRLATYPTN